MTATFCIFTAFKNTFNKKLSFPHHERFKIRPIEKQARCQSKESSKWLKFSGYHINRIILVA